MKLYPLTWDPTATMRPTCLKKWKESPRQADVPVEDLLALNGFLELHDYYSDAFLVSGCTSFMVPGDTSGEGALIAQNYDLSSIYAEAAILIKVKNEHAPDALFYTSAGMLGCAGVNDAGIGVVINNLVPSDASGGVLYPFIIRRIPRIRANRRCHRCSYRKTESIGYELRNMR